MHHSRRDFLRTTGTLAASILAAHEHLAHACVHTGSTPTDAPSRRIAALRLQTATPIPEMKAFYADVLELPILRATDEHLAFRAGTTTITFERVDPASETRPPFYHFAFNIPEDKIVAAHDWQSARTPLFTTPAHMRDPKYPDDVRHFRSWNAHSVFFADPAGNVLEHIARHDLKDDPEPHEQDVGDRSFTSRDILYASEIALVSDDVPQTSNDIMSTFDLAPYRPGSEQFQAIGDEHGLLLVFKRGRQLGLGSGKDLAAAVYAADVTIDNPSRNPSRGSWTSAPYSIRTA